jgi:hypothetical protein
MKTEIEFMQAQPGAIDGHSEMSCSELIQQVLTTTAGGIE